MTPAGVGAGTPQTVDGWAEPVCGMTWGWTGVRGSWLTPAAAHSMTELTALHPNWVTLAYAAVQETAQSTQIPYRDEPTVTDDEIRGAVARARSLGLKVGLKPVVNVADGTWRAYIGFFDWDVPGEPTWDEWFASYGEYVLHHARLAAELEVEMFCLGCEMVRADAQEAHWRALVAQVRAVYPGLITYNCDKYQEDHVTWWDAVDVISASGYYPTGRWDEQLDRIEAVVRREGKPFLFIEAGCPSRVGSAARPNDWSLVGAAEEQVQADYLDEMLSACAGRPWVGGFMLWDWPARLYEPGDAPADGGYCMYAKAGAEVVARHYAAALGHRAVAPRVIAP
ncbi:MAG: 1,4-beta-xylanase [Cellulomonas sp.]|nr:1,4-beta-xylanase [Cellulomonas sp.]